MQYLDFGKYIRDRRIKLGQSLNNFAIQCGIESSTLSRFETEESDVYFQNFIKIANGFNVTPSELLKDFDEFSNI